MFSFFKCIGEGLLQNFGRVEGICSEFCSWAFPPFLGTGLWILNWWLVGWKRHSNRLSNSERAILGLLKQKHGSSNQVLASISITDELLICCSLRNKNTNISQHKPTKIHSIMVQVFYFHEQYPPYPRICTMNVKKAAIPADERGPFLGGWENLPISPFLCLAPVHRWGCFSHTCWWTSQ